MPSYTTQLNNYLQAQGELPTLRWEESRTGLLSNRRWTVQCIIYGEVKGTGVSNTKAEAKKEAARQALPAIISSRNAAEATALRNQKDVGNLALGSNSRFAMKHPTIPAGKNSVEVLGLLGLNADMAMQTGVPARDSRSEPTDIEGPDDTTLNASESVSPVVPFQILIYQCLLSFLQDVSRAKNPSPSIASTLHEHHSTMSATDTVSALVKSRESRAALLQAASQLGIGGDPKFREALHEDETRIATYLVSILDSQAAKKAVLALEGDAAQHFLDVIQHTLDRGLLIEPEHNSKAQRMMIKLSNACDKFPSSLFITGVSGRDNHPTFGGGFGDIYRASYNGKTVALKQMRSFQRGSDLRRIRSKFCREALIWQHLKHPCILPMLGIDQESLPSSLCMVSPWMENGTVLKYLEEHGRRDVDKLLWEVAQGLEYLHSRNIVHGDLRGANILITQDWSACLADFGLTSFTDTTAATTTSHRAGTIPWMAPELIEPDRFGLRFRKTTATDVYAFACVCLELYTGRPPFADISEGGVILKIARGERPARPTTTPPMSDALWKSVNAWWAEDPVTRPPTEVVVKNVAMTQLSDLGSDLGHRKLRPTLERKSSGSPVDLVPPGSSPKFVEMADLAILLAEPEGDWHDGINYDLSLRF